MRQHTAVARWRRAGTPGARLLVLLAALTGLFAMHGLSDHGTMDHGATRSHVTAMSGVSPGALGDHGDHGVADDTSAGRVSDGVAPRDAPAVAAAGDGLDGGLHVALGLCLAVLAGAAALVLRHLRLRPSSVAHRLNIAGGQLVPVRARAPDPPDLNALCIHRC